MDPSDFIMRNFDVKNKYAVGFEKIELNFNNKINNNIAFFIFVKMKPFCNKIFIRKVCL